MQPMQLIATVRQDDENRNVAEPAGEIREQLERGWIGEMDIIDS
jgi:hypothetical protein